MPLPASAASQNPIDGRSPKRSAPNSAVASGRMPSTIAPCDAGTYRIATDENTGKPTTTPNATMTSDFH